MGDLSPWHWLIVVLVFVLLFGAKRLPDAARALGKSMRILKTEVKGLHDNDDAPEATPSQALPPAAAQSTPPPAAAVPSAATTVAAPPSTTDSSDPR